MFFWNSLAFLMIQWMLAIWPLVPLPFLNSTWTSGSLPITYYWSLAWRILSITLLACEWVQLCRSLNILWHCLSFRLEWKLTFSSPVATAEFSLFVGILSAALSQHHLLGFETAQKQLGRNKSLTAGWGTGEGESGKVQTVSIIVRWSRWSRNPGQI